MPVAGGTLGWPRCRSPRDTLDSQIPKGIQHSSFLPASWCSAVCKAWPLGVRIFRIRHHAWPFPSSMRARRSQIDSSCQAGRESPDGSRSIPAQKQEQSHQCVVEIFGGMPCLLLSSMLGRSDTAWGHCQGGSLMIVSFFSKAPEKASW